MKVLVLDLETGGLDNATCGITEIAACACSFGPTWEGPRIIGRFSRLLCPSPGLVYSEEALRVQGRTLADLEDGLTERGALIALHAFVEKSFGRDPSRKSPFQHVTAVAHNASFDIGFMEKACKRHELPMPCNFLYRCTVQYFRAWSDARGDDRRRFKLDDMMQAFGVTIPEEQRHKAYADVAATAECFGKLMRDLARPVAAMEPTPVQELITL